MLEALTALPLSFQARPGIEDKATAERTGGRRKDQCAPATEERPVAWCSNERAKLSDRWLRNGQETSLTDPRYIPLEHGNAVPVHESCSGWLSDVLTRWQMLRCMVLAQKAEVRVYELLIDKRVCMSEKRHTHIWMCSSNN